MLGVLWCITLPPFGLPNDQANPPPGEVTESTTPVAPQRENSLANRPAQAVGLSGLLGGRCREQKPCPTSTTDNPQSPNHPRPERWQCARSDAAFVCPTTSPGRALRLSLAGKANLTQGILRPRCPDGNQ